LTAVQWLLSELQIRLLKIKSEPDGIVRERMINSLLIDAEQAEAMEKQQIKFAYNDGADDTIEKRYKGMDEYYNRMYTQSNE